MEKSELTALIIRAQAGDQDAMEGVLREAHTSVSYQCRKLLRDPRDVEDITQEVLLTVYTRLVTLQTPEAFWGWLNQTTANRCINSIKRSRVELQYAEDDEGHSILDSLEELDEQQVPDKALDNTETTRMIEEIVDGLPEAQRICVLMYYYDEMSVKDIAAVLGVSENTVKSRLNYARKAVKERVLDYEKKGVKLYGLSPLPFMLYFLLRAAEETADSAAADAMAKRVVEAGASALPGGVPKREAIIDSAAAGAEGAAGTALTHAAAGLSAKLAAGVLAGLLLAGGAAAVIAARNAKEPEPTPPPAATETVPVESLPVESEPDEPEPEETGGREIVDDVPEEEPIPAERLALLNDIKYYGDPAQCRMTVNQALAYAEVLEAGSDAPYAALIDIGEGIPVLALTRGTDQGGRPLLPDPDNHTIVNDFHGRLEVWRYAGGRAELVAVTHQVRWKAGAGFVCQTRVDGIFDENGEILPGADYSHYLDYTEDAYSVEGGVLSPFPVSSAYVEVDPGPRTVSGGTVDGRPVGQAEWQALWEQQWDGEGWTAIGLGYDVVIGGPPDDGLLNTDTVSPGADTASVLRQCAGE